MVNINQVKNNKTTQENKVSDSPAAIITLLVDTSDYVEGYVDELEDAVNSFLDALRETLSDSNTLVQVLHFSDTTGIRWDPMLIRDLPPRYKMYRVGGNCNLYRAIDEAVNNTTLAILVRDEAGIPYDKGIVAVFTPGRADDDRSSAEFLEFPIERADLRVNVYGVHIGDGSDLESFDRIFKHTEA